MHDLIRVVSPRGSRDARIHRAAPSRLAVRGALALLVLAGCQEAPTQTHDEPELGQTRQALGAAAPSATGRSAQPRVVWVRMREQANLDQARATRGWSSRGEAVQRALRDTAARSQAGVRAFLAQRGANVQAFFISNALRVEADQDTIDALAARPDVAAVLPDRTYSIPPVTPGAPLGSVDATEWGLDSIRAPEAWQEFGIKGEGIVIANVDTGVQFDHPALSAQYRGNLGNGSFDHAYNWFDPSQVCGSPSLEPCDNAGHGTHTMGTMVGDDGDPGDNQIGVAPHAKWIAAKGCEDFFCSTEALLSSAEWILAPTDLDGGNPRPDLRPNIVNNSWGAPFHDPFYQDAVSAWVASGIFPSFSAGNAGPGCGSAGSPGDYENAYAVGAYDAMGGIAFFSSRGPSFDGFGKPNLAAPGVSVRSSVPGNAYEYFDGTSMAAPHLSGTVALMWAAAPALLGDIETTRALLDQTAIDVSDLSCGGSDQNNNVWGEGQLDAFAAVDASPRGPTGTLAGVVSASSDAAPIAGARIVAHPTEGRDRQTSSRPDGSYELRLSIGSYDASVSAFGYIAQTAAALEITEGNTTAQDFALELAPAHSVSGVIVDAQGAPVAGATVSILATPIPAVQTDAAGHYAFPSVPEGSYDLRVSPSRCYDAQTIAIVVDADLTRDIALTTRFDGYGYSCAPGAFEYVQADDVLFEIGDEEATSVSLPFGFTFYGQTYDSVYVGINGAISFDSPNLFGWNSPIPDTFDPNGAVYAQWDDLFTFGGGSVRTGSFGESPSRSFVIEWRDMSAWETPGTRSFEIVLHEQGDITLQYGSDDATGQSSTIGIEDENGIVALQYSFDEASVGNGTSIRYTLPPSGIVRGVVTDGNDGLPIAGAAVTAESEGTVVRSVRSRADGSYQLQVPVGDYTITAQRDRYEARSVALSIAQNGVYTADFSLSSARATITPSTIELVTTAGQVRHKTLTLGNQGTIDLVYEIAESGGRRQTTVSTRGKVKRAGFDAGARTTRDLYEGPTPAQGWTPDSPGDVLESFAPEGMSFAWGVGYTGQVWLSDIDTRSNFEFDVTGTPTGRQWSADWGFWPADMAYDGSRNLVCQIAVGGDNGIHCFDPDTGVEMETIAGAFPWTGISQRGLAYRPDDDTFYVGGWNEGIIYHIEGLSHANPGAVIEQCSPADGSISGLAWNDSMGVLWEATNSETDTIYELSPDDCTVLATLAHPTPFFNGAGIEMDDAGNLWTIGQSPNTAYLIESGVPAFADVPWLSVTPSSGTLAPGATQALDVAIDTTGMQPGVYLASIFVRSNSGRESALRIPVSLIVSEYLQALNSGGNAFTDGTGDVWAKDKKHAAGSYGYLQNGRASSTTRAIAGTTDDPLYRDLRQDMYAYRYDNVPNGVYDIDLRFAEIASTRVGRRLYDVIVENTTVLPAHDIAYEVGTFTADDHRFFVAVTDGRLDVRFVPRAGSQPPIVNAIRVTHRPDR